MSTMPAAEVQFPLHPSPRRQYDRPPGPALLPRVTQLLALALWFQQMLATGEAHHYRELARRTGVTTQRISQVMQLLWLAPDIQHEILYLPPVGGRYPVTEAALRKIALCWSWAEQRPCWQALRQQLHIAPDLTA